MLLRILPEIKTTPWEAQDMLIQSIEECIGRTPLLSAARFAQVQGLAVRLLVKLECMNPAGSVKDRVAKFILDDAEQSGKLKPGGTIIEPTSGNTGIGLAAVAAARGYKLIITMPETMSMERRMLMKAYGAELVLTDGKKGMSGAIEKADELHREIPGSLIAGQFTNPANPKAHFETTGPEIYRDTDGKVDIFVAGVGTGGTVSGVGKYLKSKNPDVKVVAVEPATSPVLSKGESGAHGIQGIGAGFVPDTLDTSVYDEVIAVMTDNFFSKIRGAGLSVGERFYEGVVLASIIEKEYQSEEEAPLIASVFVNRLKKNMRLESCATVLYVLTDIQGRPHPERLFYTDLEIESPFNTYRNFGLPPAPISNPGMVALTAAFHPAQSEYLFFVAKNDGSGRHTFSKDFYTHNYYKRHN